MAPAMKIVPFETSNSHRLKWIRLHKEIRKASLIKRIESLLLENLVGKKILTSKEKNDNKRISSLTGTKSQIRQYFFFRKPAEFITN